MHLFLEVFENYETRIIFNDIWLLYVMILCSLGSYWSFQMTSAKDPDAAFFKKLDGFQPCEITELKAGTHVFAVYGQFE